MKKIRIITFHSAHNYGAMLQAYALQKKILEFSKDVKFIDYRKKNIENSYKIFKPIRKNLIKWLKENIDSLIYYRKKKKRCESFREFLDSKLNLTETCYNDQSLKTDYPISDIYITGSDQVWNPGIVTELSDAYTLNFGPNDIKRISYAASIGNSMIEQKYLGQYTKKLSKLNCISVREEDAKVALQKLVKKDIEVVLDPTLLLTCEQWNNEIKDYNNKQQKYILAYVVEDNEEYRKIVDYISEKTGLKVIHFEKNGYYKNILKSAYTEGPLDFVNLIKNAEYVVATSFHATAFSIIFNKKFFIIPHKKTGSRVTNLLNKLQINNRIYYTLEEFQKNNYTEDIDWNNVNKILEKERNKSINWLKNAIEG